MDADQKAKHQPGGMMGVGVGSCRADRRDGWTEGERNSCGPQDHLNFFCISSLTCLHTAHYQTNEMLCKAEGLHNFSLAP